MKRTLKTKELEKNGEPQVAKIDLKILVSSNWSFSYNPPLVSIAIMTFSETKCKSCGWTTMANGTEVKLFWENFPNSEAATGGVL